MSQRRRVCLVTVQTDKSSAAVWTCSVRDCRRAEQTAACSTLWDRASWSSAGRLTASGASESLKASDTSSSHLSTKFSQLPNLRISITLSPFIRSYSCSATVIILSKNNWSLLSLCFTLSLESAIFISSSTLFWYQFLHFRLPYSFTYHFFLFWLTTLHIHTSLSLSLPP